MILAEPSIPYMKGIVWTRQSRRFAIEAIERFRRVLSPSTKQLCCGNCGLREKCAEIIEVAARESGSEHLIYERGATSGQSDYQNNRMVQRTSSRKQAPLSWEQEAVQGIRGNLKRGKAQGRVGRLIARAQHAEHEADGIGKALGIHPAGSSPEVSSGPLATGSELLPSGVPLLTMPRQEWAAAAGMPDRLSIRQARNATAGERPPCLGPIPAALRFTIRRS